MEGAASNGEVHYMKFSHDIEKFRTNASSFGDPYGLFMIPFKTVQLKVIACAALIGSDMADDPINRWEHVSVSLPNRCPNWPEMCHIKDLFWADDETVIQFHPKKSEYISIHPWCLHLWRLAGVNHELPPSIMI